MTVKNVERVTGGMKVVVVVDVSSVLKFTNRHLWSFLLQVNQVHSFAGGLQSPEGPWNI